MLENPLITVLMPVYNCANFVSEAVESILSQTYTDFEFIIIDDCSTDKTVNIIKSYTDTRIRLIEKPRNTGYTYSLNLGLEMAKGKYIARMDGDDISLPLRFEKQVAFLENNIDVVLCGTALKIIDSDRVIRYPEFHDDIKVQLLRHNCIGHPSVMLRKSILNKNSLIYNIGKEPAEDYDLWTKLVFFGKFYNLPEVLLFYRQHDMQVSKKNSCKQIDISADIKVSLIRTILFENNKQEIDLLKKIVSNSILLDIDEIQLFQVIKKKLIVANISGTFNAIGFKHFLAEIEQNLIKNYFYKRSSYTPVLIYQFFVQSRMVTSHFSLKQQFILCVKSILYWNAKSP